MTELERLDADTATVPAGYAEKTMNSLMRLHDQLMEEKERRVGLMEKLLSKEQALAEMAAYVALLEVELERKGHEPTWKPAAAREVKRPPPPRRPPPRRPPPPPPPPQRSAVDAWAEWTMAEAGAGAGGERSSPCAGSAPSRAGCEAAVGERGSERPSPGSGSGFRPAPERREDWRAW